MEFAAFAERAAAIEAEPADLAVVDRLAGLLGAAGADLPVVARYVQGRIFPGWSSRALEVGPALCFNAIARAAGPNVTADDVEGRLADLGDVGEVAASYDLAGQRGLGAFGGDDREALVVADVDRELRAVASAAGEGSEARKLDGLFGLFTRCSPIEARYLARLVLGEMRIGVGEGAVRDAIVEAFDVPPEAVERAIQASNDFGLVAETARGAGVDGLAEIRLEVGRPVKSMLAQAGSIRDALAAWGSVAVEWKLDGARVQVHADGESVRAFSRNMEAVTDPLPEVVEFVEAHLTGSAVLDGEVVAVDESGDPLPFQEVLRRFRRKHDVDAAREAVAVDLHVFDCLYADGEVLVDRPYRERREALVGILDAGVSEATITDDRGAIESIERAAVAAGHEGIMLKNPDAPYTPGKRGQNWLKRKPDVETLDLVVTGAQWGEGRRANHFGTYELSAVDSEGGFATIGNVATGMTDEEVAELTELVEPHVRGQDGRSVDVEPAVVFEVGYEEIQRSPNSESGHALRFPRFVAVREDLSPADADTIARIERLAAV